MLFADPELSSGFQAKFFGWVNPTVTMVAYAAERAVLDPNIELYAVAATTDPGGSSVLPARRAGVPHYQDCDSTRSPIDPATPAPELDETRLHRSKSCPRRRDHLILRVDRADLSKNVLRGFAAFDLFLQQHPDFSEKVTFIAHLMPSRTDVPEYAEYIEKIEALVAVVNHRHGTPDWMPIDLRMRDSLELAIRVQASHASQKQYRSDWARSRILGFAFSARPIIRTARSIQLLPSLNARRGSGVKTPAEQRLDKLEAVLLQATNDISEIAPLLADLLSIPTGSRYPASILLRRSARRRHSLHWLLRSRALRENRCSWCSRMSIGVTQRRGSRSIY